MPSRNWLPHPFLGVGLAVVLIVGGAHLYDQNVNRNCRDGTGAKECQQARNGVGVQPPAKAPTSETEAERRERREQSDLEAQWDQARATYIAVIVAVFGVAVTGAGVFFVAKTLGATRDAVRETAKGTAAAAVAAEAANKTVAVMEANAQRQLRAYVFLDTANIIRFEYGHDIIISVTIKNSGQTPARDLVHKMRGQVRNLPNDRKYHAPDRASGTPSKNPVPPGGTMTLPLALKSPMGEMKDIREGRAAIFLNGDIRYVDAFGEPRWTTYFLTAGGGNDLGAGFAACQEGNDYS